jgi:hypothetical protein
MAKTIDPSVLLEHLIGIRQQQQNLVNQITFLIEEVSKMTNPVREESSRRPPPTFGGKEEIENAP